MRLDPFALPQGTQHRFAILFQLVIVLGWHVGTYTLRWANLVEWRGVPWVLSGLCGAISVLVVAVLIMWSYPARTIRRSRLRPLGPTVDAKLCSVVQQTAATAGFGAVQFFVSDSWTQTAFAFGTARRPLIGMGGGMKVVARGKPSLLRAAVLHELAHIQNGDLTYYFLGLALIQSFFGISCIFIFIWIIELIWDFVSVWIFAEMNIGSMLYYGWEEYVPRLFIYLFWFFLLWLILVVCFRRLVQIREHYADWQAQNLGAGQELIRPIAGKRASTGLSGILARHPDPALRFEAYNRASAALRPTAIDGFLIGVLFACLALALDAEIPLRFNDSISELLLGTVGIGLFVSIGFNCASVFQQGIVARAVDSQPLFNISIDLIIFALGLYVGLLVADLAWPTSATYWVYALAGWSDAGVDDFVARALEILPFVVGLPVVAGFSVFPTLLLVKRWRRATRPRMLLFILRALMFYMMAIVAGSVAPFVLPADFWSLDDLPSSVSVIAADSLALATESPWLFLLIQMPSVLVWNLLSTLFIVICTLGHRTSTGRVWPYLNAHQTDRPDWR